MQRVGVAVVAAVVVGGIVGIAVVDRNEEAAVAGRFVDLGVHHSAVAEVEAVVAGVVWRSLSALVAAVLASDIANAGFRA